MPEMPEVELGGFTDDLKSVLNVALPLVETVLPIVAPVTAPIVAAEHLLRTGGSLTPQQAKAATTAATTVGKAAAASQGVTVEPTPNVQGSVERTQVAPERHELDTARSSSSNTLLLLGAGGVLLWILMNRR